jgi:D-amino peptidase
MKILIAADMEGISGVVNWNQVDPAHAEYNRFRQIMTGDVNAAIRGAFSAGAQEATVTDGHAYGNNLLIEELDPRARLNSGNTSPFAMVQGADGGIQGVFFIGYHARAGSECAILDHTWSSRTVANLWLNDILVGEIGFNAALCGYYGAPAVMISGDQTACAEAAALLGDIEMAVVKQATGRMAAECLPVKESQELIFIKAKAAVERLIDGKAPPPFKLEEPVQAALEFLNSEMADKASLLPGAQRKGRVISFSAVNMPAAYRGVRAAIDLAR